MSPPILLDLRSAARGLLRTPAVAISAVLCLALGIGATVAISTALDRALVERLPFRAPDRLVTVYRTTPQFDTGPFSAPNYVDLAHGSRRLASLVALTPATALLALPDAAVQVTVLRATGNVFSTLGVAAARGRVFGPDDDQRGAPAVAVLSDQLWHDRFGGDPGVVGRSISVDGEPRTIIGVLPRDFHVPHGSQVLHADIWLPMLFSDQQMAQRRSNFLMTFGRLAPGGTAENAQAELVQLFEHIVEQYPQLRGESIRVLPLQAESVRTVRVPLLLLFGAVLIVLLISASNVASLLLARGVNRQREIAIRVALGGGRWAVARSVFAESYVVVTLGLVLGLGLAWIGVRTIGAMAAERVPQLAGMTMDLRVVAFAVVLSVVVGLLCGAAPAWRGTSVNPQQALRGGRGGGSGRGHHRALGALVVAEIALSLMLLLSAGLVLRGFAALLGRDPGFETDRVLTLEATVSAAHYADGSAVRQFLEPALAAVRRLPGVESAAAISLIPYTNWGWNFNIRYEGQPADDPTRLPLAEFRVATPSFFAVTKQRLLGGRLLEASDDDRPQAQRVVVVNQALVRRDFPGESAVGRRYYTGDSTFATIVGVVSDIRNFGPVDDPHPEVYWSYRQAGGGSSTFPMMVRVRRGDPTAVAASVRQAIRAVDPGAAVTSVASMNDVIARSVGKPRFYLSLLAVFAAIAAVLAIAGIYGVMSYAVAQRTREIGIRTALGSSARRTVRLVARQGGLLVIAGVVIGAAGAAFTTHLLVTLLYGVSPLDPVAWVAAAVLLAAAGMAATLIPAARATKVDPVIAMRVE